MPNYLVIVESPTKVKTIKKFLGSNYTVVASNGHVRDLPKSTMGIDIENDYEPKYITIRGKGEKLAELRKAVKKADKVFLATDPDREGEAISWHLATALKLDAKKMQRITFNEITKNAVKASLKTPREIDMDLVDAQQTRRILDRLVGYSISPLLWQKVKRGLSAGRVQSVALKMICDREEEINAFIPEEYWTLDALFMQKNYKKPIVAHFYGKENQKFEIHNREEMDCIIQELQNIDFSVKEIHRSERKKKAPLPFTTSTLQQEASKALNFATAKTMRVAQQLYEGVDIKGHGTVGLISYLRTDSTRVSEEANAMARAFVERTYGVEYLASEDGKDKKATKIQDAHEAIRPTNMDLTPEKIKGDLSKEQFRLYQLIWRRFAASRMEAARYETTSVKIQGGEYIFATSASKMLFDGFKAVYTDTEEDEEKANPQICNMDEETVLDFMDFDAKQHFTQPPAHYTEAALVKALEEQGIGRPSTYAPTISTILARRYVVKENKNLYVTEIGEVVNEIMKTAFKVIVDVNFTANMESLLDMIGEGSVKWKTVVSNFYPDLNAAVQNAEQALEKIKIEDEVTDIICEECGRNMVVKYGPHGKFLACPGFPECRQTKPYLEKTGIPCPVCHGELVIKKTKKGRKFFGCEKHPDCDFMSWQKPLEQACPECGSYMVEKGSKAVCSQKECGYFESLQKKLQDEK